MQNILFSTPEYSLVKGDSRLAMQALEDCSIGLSVFSPPYFKVEGINYDTQDGNIEYLSSWENYCNALGEITQVILNKLLPGSRLCINVDDKYTSIKGESGKNICQHTHARLIEICTAQGYDYKGNIIWQKVRSSHASGGAGMVLGSYPYPAEIPFVTNYEYILIFRKPGKRTVSPENKEKSFISRDVFNKMSEGIWQVNGVKDKDHPAPFPVAIPSRLIQLFSFYGDTVLDPFCGVATTGKAAIALGRKFIGFDISENYLNIAHARLSVPSFEGLPNTASSGLAGTHRQTKLFPTRKSSVGDAGSNPPANR